MLGSSSDAIQSSVPRPLVGRDAELSLLGERFDKARSGKRQLVFVTGEAGIGKTSLVDEFCLRILAPSDALVARGQCVQQFGPSEPYLPLLDASHDLVQSADGDRVVQLLSRHAPSWLAQLPSALDDDSHRRLLGRTHGTPASRALREMAQATEALCEDRPLVVVLEDLHWSDMSTLDWLSFVARRREAARLMLVCTYRPVDGPDGRPPVRRLAEELLRLAGVNELFLPALTREQVQVYLAGRLGGADVRERAGQLYELTGGHPLFVVTLADDWSRGSGEDGVKKSVVGSLEGVIETQFSRLNEDDYRVLEAASVVGNEFSAVLVARALGGEERAVESTLDRLTDTTGFVRAEGLEQWPDGTLSGRYRFHHTLHRTVLYDRAAAASRARIHRIIAISKRDAYRDLAPEIAAELAAHFEAGQDVDSAIEWLAAAGQHAASRNAYREAEAHLTRAIELLKELPESAKRDERELRLRILLSPVIMASRGYAAVELGENYQRTHQLAEREATDDALFLALQGLRAYAIVQGRNAEAREIAARCQPLAEKSGDAGRIAQAHWGLGEVALFEGRFNEARGHLEDAVRLKNDDEAAARAMMFGQDPSVVSAAYLGLTLWFLGDSRKALKLHRRALAMAQQSGHANTVAFTLMMKCLTRMQCRDMVELAQDLNGLVLYTSEYELPVWADIATILVGWLRAVRDGQLEGVRETVEGMQRRASSGGAAGKTMALATLADAALCTGQLEIAEPTVAEGLRASETSGETWCLAELWRLKGKIEGQRGNGDEAGASFERAIEVARGQNSTALELRASIDLARWQSDHANDWVAVRTLTTALAKLPPGADTEDTRQASARLKELGQAWTTPGFDGEENESTLDFIASGHLTSPAESAPRTTALEVREHVFKREGDFWALTFRETTHRVKDSRGMQFLAQLLAHPNEQMHSLTLCATGPIPEANRALAGELGSLLPEGFPLVDAQARAAYQARLLELRDSLDEAEHLNDQGRVEKLQSELAFLQSEISRAVGLRGRARRSAGPAERARVNVTRALKGVLNKLDSMDPELVEHLRRTIRTGMFCSYDPDPDLGIRWRVED